MLATSKTKDLGGSSGIMDLLQVEQVDLIHMMVDISLSFRFDLLVFAERESGRSTDFNIRSRWKGSIYKN